DEPMKQKGLLLVITGATALTVAALVALAASADLQPMVINNLTGALHVQQVVPKTDAVDLFTPVIGGRIELAPSEGNDILGGKQFTLTRADVAFAGFSVHRECCLGLVSETRTYTDINVMLVRAVTFTSFSSGPGRFAFRIPKSDFVMYEAATANGRPETGYKTPIEDPTGTIDFAGRVHMHVVFGTLVHFQGG